MRFTLGASGKEGFGTGRSEKEGKDEMEKENRARYGIRKKKTEERDMSLDEGQNQMEREVGRGEKEQEKA